MSPRLTYFMLALLFVLIFFQGAILEYGFGSIRRTEASDSAIIVHSIEQNPGEVATKAVIELILVGVLVAVGLGRRQDPAGRFGFAAANSPAPLSVPTLPGFWLCLAYVAWCALSGLFNDQGVLISLKYCRYVFYAYCMFALVSRLPWDPVRIQNLLILLAGLCLVQIPASLGNLIIRGLRDEFRVGTMTVSGGELGTVFPLLVFGFIMGIYLFRLRTFWMLLLAVAFGIVGFSNGKRAFYYFMPGLACLGLAVYASLPPWVRPSGWRKVVPHATLAILCAIPLLLYGIRQTEGLSRTDDKVSLVDQITFMIQSATEYETGNKFGGVVIGRSAASRRVLEEHSHQKPTVQLLGYGPEPLLQTSVEFAPYDIDYGIVGWSRDVISIGWIGAALYVGMILRILAALHRILFRGLPSAFWNALAYGSYIGFCVLLITYFSYGSIFATLPVASFGLMFIAGLVLRRSRSDQPAWERAWSPAPSFHFPPS